MAEAAPPDAGATANEVVPDPTQAVTSEPVGEPVGDPANEAPAEGPVKSPGDDAEAEEEAPNAEVADAEAADAADAEAAPKSKSHLKTIGISISPGFGYGITLAGDKFCGAFSESADDSDGRRPVCTDLTPAYLDIALSYGVTKRIDLVFGARVNLQKRSYDAGKCAAGESTCVAGEGLFVDRLGVGIFPGIRIWGKGTERTVKIGAGIDFMVMFENFDGYRSRPRYEREEPEGSAQFAENRTNEAALGDVELGFRVGPVLAVDPHHNFGLFFFPSIHPSVRPSKAAELDSGWIQIGVDFSAGIQARFP